MYYKQFGLTYIILIYLTVFLFSLGIKMEFLIEFVDLKEIFRGNNGRSNHLEDSPIVQNLNLNILPFLTWHSNEILFFISLSSFTQVFFQLIQFISASKIPASQPSQKPQLFPFLIQRIKRNLHKNLQEVSFLENSASRKVAKNQLGCKEISHHFPSSQNRKLLVRQTRDKKFRQITSSIRNLSKILSKKSKTSHCSKLK